MLRLEAINKNNIDYAITIQKIIFPEYSGRNNYIRSLDSDSNSIFFLLYDDDLCVGITGLYFYKDDMDNAWLGFFGILEKYRKKRYGKNALKLTEEYAKMMGYKFIRLFTDKEDNEYAIKFYEMNGYTFEDYNCHLEALRDEFNVVIGSKSLCELEVDKWNNRFLNITKQTIKQIEK